MRERDDSTPRWSRPDWLAVVRWRPKRRGGAPGLLAGDERDHPKQIVVAVVIALLAGGTAPWWWTAIFHGSGGGGGATRSFSIPRADPAISLSQRSGPSETHVKVSDLGFPSGESVELRFHTEALPPARTDAKGTFEDEIVVPGTFDAFAGQQFEITATTTPTVCSDSAPFSLTG